MTKLRNKIRNGIDTQGSELLLVAGCLALKDNKD